MRIFSNQSQRPRQTSAAKQDFQLSSAKIKCRFFFFFFNVYVILFLYTTSQRNKISMTAAFVSHFKSHVAHHSLITFKHDWLCLIQREREKRWLTKNTAWEVFELGNTRNGLNTRTNHQRSDIKGKSCLWPLLYKAELAPSNYSSFLF